MFSYVCVVQKALPSAAFGVSVRSIFICAAREKATDWEKAAAFFQSAAFFFGKAFRFAALRYKAEGARRRPENRPKVWSTLKKAIIAAFSAKIALIA